MGIIMDVVVWLRSLGLEEYEEAFRDNKIDERVLPNLTQEDLKEIGVGPVGDRQRPPLTPRPRRVRQAHIPKTAPNAAK